MSDAALIEQARAAVGRIVAGHVNPPMVERAVLVTVAGEDLADRTWKAGTAAGEAARAHAARLLRERHGALNPRRGWLLWFLFLSLLAAALAAVFATGLRTDPAVTAPWSGGLGAAVAAMNLVTVAVAGRRPLNFAYLRAQVPTAILMIVAAVLMLSRTVDLWSILAAGGAVVAALALGLIAVVRRARPEDTRRIDTALQTAYLDAAPAVREGADRAQRDVLAELGPERAAQVVRVRTAVVDEAKAAHPALADVSPATPAGGVIIQELAGKWLPLDMTDEWKR